mgnify:CR=1 FL=1
MTAQEAALSWLEDPQVYAVNRIEAHSDHFFYEEMPDTGREEKMPLRQSLDGIWYFAYASNPAMRIQEFYRRSMTATASIVYRFPDIYRRKAMTGTSMSMSCIPGTEQRN